jgi:hypothetical protein
MKKIFFLTTIIVVTVLTSCASISFNQIDENLYEITREDNNIFVEKINDEDVWYQVPQNVFLIKYKGDGVFVITDFSGKEEIFSEKELYNKYNKKRTKRLLKKIKKGGVFWFKKNN